MSRSLLLVTLFAASALGCVAPTPDAEGTVFPCVEDADCAGGYSCDVIFATCRTETPPGLFDPGDLVADDRGDPALGQDAQDGSYPDDEVAPSLVFEETFTRRPGAPRWSVAFFELEEETAEGLVVIRNDGCSSARISLNGEVILRPSDLNANVVQVERSVGLEGSNQLRARLASTPGCEITVDVVALLER
jgi:hypothetical protein